METSNKAQFCRLSENYMEPFPNPTPGEISIVAESPFTHKTKLVNHVFYGTKEDFELVKECGFNAVKFSASSDTNSNSYDTYKSVLEKMEGVGLKAIISGRQLIGNEWSDPTIANQYCSYLVNTYKCNNLIGAWQVMDEPYWDNWHEPESKNLKDADAKDGYVVNLPYFFKLVRNLDPQHPVFVNLAVSTAENRIGKLPSYRDYLDFVQSSISPDIWSYDFYPIFFKKNGINSLDEGNNPCIYFAKDRFYNWLETFKWISEKTGKPFWAYCLSMAHNEYPLPTEGQLRLEAFSALAYGAQGIVYYRYSADQYDNPALVNSNGDKTLIWEVAKKVNQEIAFYNYIFSGCRVRLLTHTDGKPFTVKVAPISKVEYEEDVVVSTIEKDGKTYYVFVSTNPFESIVVKFTRNNDNSNAWSPVTSNLTPLNNLKEGPEFEIMFEPGGYGIIQA